MKKKIFFLGQLFPYPLDNGGKIKTYNTLKTLAMHYEVTAVFISEIQPPDRAVHHIKKMGIDVKVYYKPDVLDDVLRHPVRLIWSYMKRIPHMVDKYYSPQIHQEILQMIHLMRPDVIHVCHSGLAVYLPKQPAPAITIADLENIETHVAWSRFCYTQEFFRKVYIGIEMVFLYWYERHKLRLYNHIFAICSEDKALLNRLFGRTHVTVQPVVFPVPVPPLRNVFTPSLLFIGDLRWPPNEDALKWFLERIYPLFLKYNPNVILQVIGKNQEQFRDKWKKIQSVKFLGYRASLISVLSKRPIFILPFRIVAGVKLKALTAFAHGLPVVSTEVGVRGYAAQSHAVFLQANTEDMFARQLVRLVNDHALARKLGVRARHYVKRFHGYKQSKQFLRDYAKILNRYET